MPLISVWPVCSSTRTRKVGSSSARRCSALASLSWSALLLGSTAIEITGSGNSIASNTIGVPGSASVSPVKVCFRPTIAPMSPARIIVTSSRFSA